MCDGRHARRNQRQENGERWTERKSRKKNQTGRGGKACGGTGIWGRAQATEITDIESQAVGTVSETTINGCIKRETDSRAS